jgi:hypothetical protein
MSTDKEAGSIDTVYKVTFDQLRALYMKGMAAAPSIEDGQKSEGV